MMSIGTGERIDVAVVGGGLAGLAAAALAGAERKSVVVFDKARAVGGRAGTQTKAGFSLNQGPHALYRGGPAMRVLERLAIRPSGGVPNVAGSFAFDRGRFHTLPGGFVSLLTTSLLSLGGKLELGGFFGRLPRIDPGPLDHTSVETWLTTTFRDADVPRFVRAFVRLTTYAADSRRLSAGTAIRQMQSALKNGVVYLDGGWQTLVDALAERIRDAGGRVAASERVVAIESTEHGHRVRLAGGGELTAKTVIVTAPPATAAEIVAGGRHDGLRRAAELTQPVRAACLDLALSTTPRPKAKFALGVDRPLYYSVHSASARLAPPGGALVHLAKYLGGDAADDLEDAAPELEALADRLQPGWRDVLVERRFLPNMIVANDLPMAERGGLAGRVNVAVEDVPGVFLAGDWVGDEALLADASFASAEVAAALAIRYASDRFNAAAA